MIWKLHCTNGKASGHGIDHSSNSAAWLLLRRWCFFTIGPFLFLGYAYWVIFQSVIRRARPRSTSARHPRLQNPDRLANYAMCSADKRIRLAKCLADAPPICKERRRIGWLRPPQAFLRVHIFPILDAAVWCNPICAPVQLYYNSCAHSAVYVHRSEWQRERAQTDGEEIKKEISELLWGTWTPFPFGTARLARFLNYPCIFWISHLFISVHGVKWLEDSSLEIGQLENSQYRWLEQGSRHGWCYRIAESPPQYMKNTEWWWKTTSISQCREGILDTDCVLCVNLCSSQRERYRRGSVGFVSRETGKRPISWAPWFMSEFIWGFITEDDTNSHRKAVPRKMIWKRDAWELTEENDRGQLSCFRTIFLII